LNGVFSQADDSAGEDQNADAPVHASLFDCGTALDAVFLAYFSSLLLSS
jgi:hypothetical protein